MRSRKVKDLIFAALPILLALAFGTFLLLLVGAPPLVAYKNILEGAFESPAKWAWVATTMVPIVLCSAGLLVSFSTGLWNIGVEGQIIVGAIFASWLALSFTLPSPLFIPLLLITGMVGGAIWGLLVGWLKIKGSVNEIFGGVGLNFIAINLTNYLILGPWRAAKGGSLSGTDPFPPEALLSRLGDLPVYPVAVITALAAMLTVSFLLRYTMWGLRLRAIGKNPRSTVLREISIDRYTLSAFLVCGSLAGLAGAILATGIRGRLIPGISSGYGFLALLVVLLVSYRPLWVIPVAFLFAAIGVGSPRLELNLRLDSAIGGTIELTLVLLVLLARGWRKIGA